MPESATKLQTTSSSAARGNNDKLLFYAKLLISSNPVLQKEGTGRRGRGRQGKQQFVPVTQLCIWFECVDELLPLFFQ